MSPLLHLVRSESKTEVSSRPWFQNQISTDTFLSSHHNATICTSCLDTWQREQKSRNLYWQDWVCHAEESDVRGEMSVFMPKSDSHCISPTVVLRNNNLWDVNTMKKNPCNRSCRCQSVWHEKNLKRQKTTVRSRYLRWIPFQLTRFCCPSAISTNQSFARLRERLTQCSLPECSPPPSLTSVHHEKCKQFRCVTARMSDTRWPQTKQPDARSPS